VKRREEEEEEEEEEKNAKCFDDEVILERKDFFSLSKEKYRA